MKEFGIILGLAFALFIIGFNIKVYREDRRETKNKIKNHEKVS